MTSPVFKRPAQPSDVGDSVEQSSAEWAVYAEGVRFLALRALRDADAAEDVAQETVLRAWRATVERRGEPIADPVAFVYGIARHVIAHVLRVRGRTVSMDVVEPIAATERDALDSLVSAEERHRLRQALRKLPSAERALLVMSYVNGMTSVAIAKRLGESAEAIRKRKSRAVERLRAAFRDK